MLNRFKQVTFTEDGTWTCPAGVTEVIVFGQGGGSGGDSLTSSSGTGGIATYLQPVPITVTPGTTYNIVIGQGGAAGVSGSTVGKAGTDTSFGSQVWKGAPQKVTSTSYNLVFAPFNVRPYTASGMQHVARPGYTGGAQIAFGGRTAYSSMGMPGEGPVGTPNTGSGGDRGQAGSSGQLKIFWIE